jgi:cell wall-associated NlpC family hydrolase
MKTPFFHNSMRRAALFAEAQSWIGTPFVPHSHVKHAGVDCVHLCAEIYVACGLMSEYHFPQYTMDGGNHLAQSTVIEWLDHSGHFVKMATAPLQAGDLICVRIRHVEHHIGIMLSEFGFIHCLYKRKVTMDHVGAWRQHITAKYRPVEETV